MSNSLNVIDFTKREKRYKLECGEFLLKPPYMNIVSQAANTIKTLEDIGKNSNEFNPSDFEKIAELQIQLLKLILEETDKGKLESITIDNFRADIAQRIIQDFFQQFKM